MTFANEIEEVVTGEIIAVVIGEKGWSGYGDEHGLSDEHKGKVLTWLEARPLLDYDYDKGYGAPDCHAVAVYTEDEVIMAYQYDGATGLFTVKRNPVPHSPEMPGG